MVDGCFKKCVPRFHDAELNTGEQVCVDRCIAKYMDVRLLPACVGGSALGGPRGVPGAPLSLFVTRADCVAAGGLVLDPGRQHPALHGAAGGGLSRVERATVCASAGRH